MEIDVVGYGGIRPRGLPTHAEDGIERPCCRSWLGNDGVRGQAIPRVGWSLTWLRVFRYGWLPLADEACLDTPVTNRPFFAALQSSSFTRVAPGTPLGCPTTLPFFRRWAGHCFSIASRRRDWHRRRLTSAATGRRTRVAVSLGITRKKPRRGPKSPGVYILNTLYTRWALTESLMILLCHCEQLLRDEYPVPTLSSSDGREMQIPLSGHGVALLPSPSPRVMSAFH